MEQGNINDSVERLMKELGSEDWIVRQRARHSLVKIGEPAVDSLIRAFRSENKATHYEAAKALSQIGNKKAIDTFIKALEDEDFSVRWVAAEGLIAIGRSTIKPLLEALEHHSDSSWIREGAHHVFHDLVGRELVDKRTKKILLRVLEAYNHFGLAENLLVAANKALDKLKVRENVN